MGSYYTCRGFSWNNIFARVPCHTGLYPYLLLQPPGLFPCILFHSTHLREDSEWLGIGGQPDKDARGPHFGLTHRARASLTGWLLCRGVAHPPVEHISFLATWLLLALK